MSRTSRPTSPLPTGSIVVLTGPDGERTMITSRGANLNLCQADVPAALLDGADLLHLTGYTLFEPGTRAVARGLIAEAGRRGIPFTVDPGSAAFLGALGPGEFLGWTSTAAVCFPNHDEAVVLAGWQLGAGRQAQAARASSQTRAWRTRHPSPRSWHGTTAWSRSSWARTARWSPPPERAEPVKVPAVPALVRDTTGAGDAFCAGFLAAWLAGARLQTAAAAGTRAASTAVSLLGRQRQHPTLNRSSRPGGPLPGISDASVTLR